MDFEKLYQGSYYTICGAGGDIQDWKDGYDELLKKANIGKPVEYVVFYGKEMNEYYELTGDNRYPEDFTFLAFPLTGLDIDKLAMFKLAMRDRWFDDIVDNNRRRENEKQS